ncbi:MAG TPA: 4a-hydroxytetrahydrobiopterin dehydratase [Nitrososphaeraceae archaeon]|nr:4a-hydroxytetrahydrobiopterin dehydratase [Nitrososphaeraceae archaeon]
MKKRNIVMINILLLIIVTSVYTSVMGQTEETISKNNTTVISINGSYIKDALASVHNDTIPHYLKLSENEINEALKDLPGWIILDDKLHKTFTFVDFSTLFEFMYQVADVSQKLNHHPNMTSTWNTLTLDYDTWSLGHVISNLDVKAAGIIEKLYQEGKYADIGS